MVSALMKKVAAQAKEQDAQRKQVEAFKPHRSELLKGVEHIERWLSEQVKAHKKDKNTSAETKSKYAQIVMTLEATRSRPGEPVQIEKTTNSKNTFTCTELPHAGPHLNAAVGLKAYKKRIPTQKKSGLSGHAHRCG